MPDASSRPSFDQTQPRRQRLQVFASGMTVLALLLLLGVAAPGSPAPTPPSADPDTTHIGTGIASYYGDELAGRPTASGEPFTPSQLTAAHRTLPFGTKLRVTNLRNGRTAVVRINDRGPFARRRIIDLSYAAARRLGMVQAGTARVRLDLLR